VDGVDPPPPGQGPRKGSLHKNHLEDGDPRKDPCRKNLAGKEEKSFFGSKNTSEQKKKKLAGKSIVKSARKEKTNHQKLKEENRPEKRAPHT